MSHKLPVPSLSHRASQQGIPKYDCPAAGEDIQILYDSPELVPKVKGWEAEAAKRRPILILCPSSVVSNWQNEFRVWGSFHVVKYHGSTADKEAAIHAITSGSAEVRAQVVPHGCIRSMLHDCTARPLGVTMVQLLGASVTVSCRLRFTDRAGNGDHVRLIQAGAPAHSMACSCPGRGPPHKELQDSSMAGCLAASHRPQARLSCGRPVSGQLPTAIVQTWNTVQRYARPGLSL